MSINEFHAATEHQVERLHDSEAFFIYVLLSSLLFIAATASFVAILCNWLSCSAVSHENQSVLQLASEPASIIKRNILCIYFPEETSSPNIMNFKFTFLQPNAQFSSSMISTWTSFVLRTIFEALKTLTEKLNAFEWAYLHESGKQAERWNEHTYQHVAVNRCQLRVYGSALDWEKRSQMQVKQKFEKISMHMKVERKRLQIACNNENRKYKQETFNSINNQGLSILNMQSIKLSKAAYNWIHFRSVRCCCHTLPPQAAIIGLHRVYIYF